METDRARSPKAGGSLASVRSDWRKCQLHPAVFCAKKRLRSGEIRFLPAVTAGTRCVLLARLGGEIAGTVQLDLATPPNQPHRADVKKLLVHPDFRRRGIAGSLMVAIEEQAWNARRTLLVLDTVSNGAAEGLYLSLGYQVAGVIPGYAFNFNRSVLEATTVMYKQLCRVSGETQALQD